MKEQPNSSPLLRNILLIWGDCSRSFQDRLAGKDDINRYYLDIVFGKLGFIFSQNFNFIINTKH